MRAATYLLTVTFLWTGAAGAAGQPNGPGGPPGEIDLGVRMTGVTGDEARFQRFRDLGEGGFLNRFRFERTGNRWILDLRADAVGRQDQRYFAAFRHGKIKASFRWDQVPLFYSRDTRTLYNEQSPGVLRIADSIQQSIELGQLRLADVVGGASRIDTRSRRDIAQFSLIFSPRRELDVKFDVRTANRHGTMPFGAAFGFSNAIELAAPVESRTTDVNAGAEWTGPRGSLRVAYDGSWFDNRVPTLIWDNPLRMTDTTFATAYSAGTASSQGRLALWPDSTLHAVTTAGSVKLPANSRATGHISLGTWRQDDALLPFTINTAIAPITLPRRSADTEARTVAMNYTFTSRPSSVVWLNARFRYYDFDNRTPDFPVSTYVRLDGVAYQAHGGPEYTSLARHTFDLDASFTPVPFSAARIGYSREWNDRTHRIFERTTDNVVRASIDATRLGWVTIRGIVERATRTGSGFDEEALVESGEQPAMRHFDVADRIRNRATVLIQAVPGSLVAFSASAATGRDDYEKSGFGLRDSRTRSYTASLDLTPRDEVAVGLSYVYDRYTALQNSRNASPGPQFDDPRRNWSIDSADRTDTVTADLGLLKMIPNTELRLAYSFTRSRAVYVYGVPADSTLTTPQQLPPVKNQLQNGTLDVRYFLTDRLALGLGYWYDSYKVEDFAQGPTTISRLDLPGSLFLGYLYRPYTANTAWLRVLYSW